MVHITHFNVACRPSLRTPAYTRSLINKVVAQESGCLYLMSSSNTGFVLIPSLYFETDGYYYYNKKKIANYFSSRRQKQLTTGIMC